jgi:polar amino acid transport system substrate-binding protein
MRSTPRYALLVLGIVPVGLVLAMAMASSSAARTQGGTLTYCTDIGYPPIMYRNGHGRVTGTDFDSGTEVARRLGKKAVFLQVGFDGIFQALVSKKCDAIIDGVSDTRDREKQALFVDYAAVGQWLIVNKGNPRSIHQFSDLCGLAAGAALASTNIAYLRQVSHQCTVVGKRAINVIGFRGDTDGLQALKTKKIHAFDEDSWILAYFVTKYPALFETAAQPVRRIPVGVAVRRNDLAFAASLRKAFNDMYADGTMRRIYGKYGAANVLLTGSRPATLNAAAKGP